ncbi:MAG: hypothetical protein AB1442_18090, partial [Nitrospirota bacterium]
MRDLFTLFLPVVWSLKNDILKFSGPFYRKSFYYIVSAGIFMFLFVELLSAGMTRLHNLSADVFRVLLIKAYSLTFLIIFLIQVVNGFVISLTSFYHARDLEVLFTSPVNRTSLFFSRLVETHIKASWMLIIFGMPLLIAAGHLYRPDLLFYCYAFLLFSVFSVIPVNIGAGMALFMSRFFSLRRLKKFFYSAAVLVAALFVVLLRIFRPERLVNPEFFANLTLFLNELNTPSFVLMPSRWLGESLFDFLGKSMNADTIIFIALL